MLLGSVAGNFGSYLYHLLMGRMLGPVNYGILESLISLNYFLIIPISVLALVIVKFVSSQKDNPNLVSLFIFRVTAKVALWGFLALIVFLGLFPLLKNLIKVDSFVLFLGIGLATYFGIFGSIFSSSLQGLARFGSLSILNGASSWSKTLMAVFLVLVGLNVYGSVYALAASSVMTIFMGFYFLRKYVNLKAIKEKTASKINFPKMKSYSLSVFVFNLSLTSLYTLDIILSKYFLLPEEAGQYAALSVLGKTIFFASSPVAAVMFPLISERFAKKSAFQNVFLQSMALVMIISISISLLYFFYPQLMIRLLFGNAYLKSAQYLGYFAIFISLYSLCYLLLNFFLSIAKTKIVFVSLGVAFLQAVLIYFFHNNIFDIVKVNIFSVSLLFVILLVFLLKQKRWIFYQ